MYSYEIQDALEHDKDFVGVFSMDNVPDVRRGKIVVNLESRNLPGSHWVAVDVADTHTTYFDPLAGPPHNFALKYIKFPLYVSCKSVQHYTDVNCGQHVIRFLSYNVPSIMSEYFEKY